jgi:hypothetical protein
LELKISIEEKKGVTIEKYVENKLHIKIYQGIRHNYKESAKFHTSSINHFDFMGENVKTFLVMHFSIN